MSPQSPAKSETARLPVFQRFIDDLRALWAAEPDTKTRMEKAKPLLENLVMNASL